MCVVKNSVYFIISSHPNIILNKVTNIGGGGKYYSLFFVLNHGFQKIIFIYFFLWVGNFQIFFLEKRNSKEYSRLISGFYFSFPISNYSIYTSLHIDLTRLRIPRWMYITIPWFPGWIYTAIPRVPSWSYILGMVEKGWSRLGVVLSG